jgi:hypothetical protein
MENMLPNSNGIKKYWNKRSRKADNGRSYLLIEQMLI